MCFSSTVSFTAAIVLAGFGFLTLRHVKNRDEIYLASVPFLFSLQQFIEGLNWLNITYWHMPLWSIALSLSFLFFAMVAWPIIIPLAIYKVEEEPHHKKKLFPFVLLGTFTGLSSLIYAGISQAPYELQVVNHSILYEIQLPLYNTYTFYLLYLISTVGACFMSSARLLRWLGLAILLSAFITDIFWHITFVSVWCFFAAILSLLLYFYFRKKDQEVKGWRKWFKRKRL